MRTLAGIFMLVLGICVFQVGTVKAMEQDETVLKTIKLCEDGNSTACFKMGERNRIIERDLKKALPFYEKACDGGYMTGCTNGGILLQMKGKQYSPEWKKAGKMYDKACDAGEDRACFNMGSLKYREGRAKSALKYYTKACEMGNIPACDNKANLSD